MGNDYSDSATATLEREENSTESCEYCGKPTEKRKTSCISCLKENNPEAEILPEDYLEDFIEVLDISYFTGVGDNGGTSEVYEEDVNSYFESESSDDDQGFSDFAAAEDDDDIESEKEDRFATSRTSRFQNKTSRARDRAKSRKTPGAEKRSSSSSSTNTKKSIAKVKHEKQANLIIYAGLTVFSIIFVAVLFSKIETYWLILKNYFGF